MNGVLTSQGNTERRHLRPCWDWNPRSNCIGSPETKNKAKVKVKSLGLTKHHTMTFGGVEV